MQQAHLAEGAHGLAARIQWRLRLLGLRLDIPLRRELADGSPNQVVTPAQPASRPQQPALGGNGEHLARPGRFGQFSGTHGLKRIEPLERLFQHAR